MERLNVLSDLAKKGLTIVLDKTYPVNEVRNAYEEAAKGKIIGKSVIVLAR
jgi:D-arabinose 1-dehydrogenase-like Zn-dependent alcohol dehydrogenase